MDMYVIVMGVLLNFRKERKMFEAYQQQARTARDRKDKEDISALRNQVSSTGRQGCNTMKHANSMAYAPGA